MAENCCYRDVAHLYLLQEREKARGRGHERHEPQVDASLIALAALERYLAACSLTRTIQNVSATQNREVDQAASRKACPATPAVDHRALPVPPANWSARTAWRSLSSGGTSHATTGSRDSDRHEASKLLADRGWGQGGGVRATWRATRSTWPLRRGG